MYRTILNIAKNLNKAERNIKANIYQLEQKRGQIGEHSKYRAEQVEKKIALLKHYEEVIPQMKNLIIPLVDEGVSALEDPGDNSIRNYVDNFISQKSYKEDSTHEASIKRVERF